LSAFSCTELSIPDVRPPELDDSGGYNPANASVSTAATPLSAVDLASYPTQLVKLNPFKLRRAQLFVHGGKTLEFLAMADPNAARSADRTTGGVPSSADFDVVIPVKKDTDSATFVHTDGSIFGIGLEERFHEEAIKFAGDKAVYDFVFKHVRDYMLTYPSPPSHLVTHLQARAVDWSESDIRAAEPTAMETVSSGPLLLTRRTPDSLMVRLLFEAPNVTGDICKYADHAAEFVKDVHYRDKELESVNGISIPTLGNILNEQLSSMVSRFIGKTRVGKQSLFESMLDVGDRTAFELHTGKCQVDLRRVRWLIAFAQNTTVLARPEHVDFNNHLSGTVQEPKELMDAVHPRTYQNHRWRGGREMAVIDRGSFFVQKMLFTDLPSFLNELRINDSYLENLCGRTSIPATIQPEAVLSDRFPTFQSAMSALGLFGD